MLGFSFLLMTREAKKQTNSMKPEKTPATKSTTGYNYCLSPRTTPSHVKQRLANKQHRRSQKENKIQSWHKQQRH